MEVPDSACEGLASTPPFPNDVPTAPLLRISLNKLMNNDPDESSHLFTACKDLGFFYLDLSGTPQGQSILEDADKLFDVGKELYDLPLEEKQRYNVSVQTSFMGYKGYGTSVIDQKGTLDRNELYNVSKDDVLSLSPPLPSPRILSARRNLLDSFIRTSHSVVSLLLTHLNTHLRLPPSTLQNLHRLGENSGDHVRFLKTPPQPVDDRRTALGEHTDFGAVTLLFNRLGGLQVLPPGDGAGWCFVRPLPRHAVVNLGDAMVKFTNGLLRSNVHRVASPPGAQASHTRYSLVYFARPGDEVRLKRLKGSDVIPALPEGEVEEEVSAKEWIVGRATGKRVKGTESVNKRSRM